MTRRASWSCCKCIFNQIKANLAEIQPQNHQNVQKNAFLAKSSRSHWVKILLIWARDMVTWYWFAETLFWQLSVNHNVDFRYQRCTYGNGATLLFCKVWGLAYGRTGERTSSHVNFFSLIRWVTKCSKVWGSARGSARRSSAMISNFVLVTGFIIVNNEDCWTFENHKTTTKFPPNICYILTLGLFGQRQ